MANFSSKSHFFRFFAPFGRKKSKKFATLGCTAGGLLLADS